MQVGDLSVRLGLDIGDLTRGLEKAKADLSGFGQKMKDVGKNLSLKVTAPIAAIGGVAAKAGMDFQAAMSEVSAISGASGNEFAALEAKAKEMGATTKFSASEAADGLKYMAMAGWDTSKMLDGLEGIMMLAASSGEDLGMVSDIVTDAMTAFGMEAARAGEFADTLAAAASSSNTNVGMLGESFKYVAPVAGALGYTAKDTAIALGLMANAGIKGTQSGTAMRSMLTRMIKPTKESGDAMDALGIKMTNADGTMKSFAEVMGDLRAAFKHLDPDQKAFYAAQIAGQEAMSGLLAIVNTSDEDFNNLSESINGSTGAAKKMSEVMIDNLAGDITILKSGLEGLAIQIFEAIMPALRDMVQGLQGVVGKLSKLSPGMQKFLIVTAAVAAAIGPLLIVVGMMAQGLGAIIGVAGAVSGALAAAGGAAGIFGGALAVITGPIGIAIAAIAGLVAAGVLLYKNWDEIKAFSGKLWGDLKKGWSDGMASMKKALSDFGKQISESWSKTWNGIKDFFSKWGKDLLLVAVGPTGWAVLLARKLGINWETIKTTTGRVWEGIKNAIVNPVEAAKRTLDNIIQRIKNAFANMRITIPRPKLPHINVNWESVGVGDARVNIPKFRLNWYAQGGIFDRPSVIGVGEAGKEVVMPLDKLPSMISAALREALKGDQMALAGDGGITINYYGSVRNDQDIPRIARELYNLQQQNARGRGLR